MVCTHLVDKVADFQTAWTTFLQAGRMFTAGTSQQLKVSSVFTQGAEYPSSLKLSTAGAASSVQSCLRDYKSLL